VLEVISIIAWCCTVLAFIAAVGLCLFAFLLIVLGCAGALNGL
jgi:hypothetical protein